MAFKNDARHCSESNYRLTDFGARSGGEGEIGALVLGTYEFTESVNEITLHPRPASLRRAAAVETDHPLIQLSLKHVHYEPLNVTCHIGNTQARLLSRLALSDSVSAQ